MIEYNADYHILTCQHRMTKYALIPHLLSRSKNEELFKMTRKKRSYTYQMDGIEEAKSCDFQTFITTLFYYKEQVKTPKGTPSIRRRGVVTVPVGIIDHLGLKHRDKVQIAIRKAPKEHEQDATG